MRHLSRQDKVLLLVLLLLVVTLPVSLLFSRERTDLRPRAEFADATFSFNPASVNVGENQTVPVAVYVNTETQKISGLDLQFAVGGSGASITSIEPNTDPTGPFTDTLINQNGRLALVSKLSTLSLHSGNVKVADINITGVADGTTSLSVTPREIVGFNAQEADVALAPAGALSIPITIGEGVAPTIIPPGTPLLQGKMRFRGLVQNFPSLVVKVRVINEATLTPATYEIDATVVHTSNGVYTFSSPLPLINLPPGSGYSIYIKGPKHLRKKLSNRVELQADVVNEFDWTADKLLLEPGDLPNPQFDYQQDGVVNSYDASLLNQRIVSSAEADLRVADLNFDRIVNGFDFGLLLETLSTRYDDEE